MQRRRGELVQIGEVFSGLDAGREINLYAWGPAPRLVSADLDRYIEESSAGLDAARNLRDWVLHPGGSRQPDSAMEMLFSAGGAGAGDAWLGRASGG